MQKIAFKKFKIENNSMVTQQMNGLKTHEKWQMIKRAPLLQCSQSELSTAKEKQSNRGGKKTC